MRKKLALLLAAIMVLTMLPSMSAYGASENKLTKTVTVIPGKSVLFEEGMTVGNGNNSVKLDGSSGAWRIHDDIEYAVVGTSLVIKVQDVLTAGEQFKISLENAKWFFRGDSTTSSTTASGATANLNNLLSFNSGRRSSDWTGNAREKWDNTRAINYDLSKGIYGDLANSRDRDGVTTIGEYFRFEGQGGTGRDSSDYREIPYKLSVSAATDTEAVITVLSQGSGSGDSTYNAKGEAGSQRFWQIVIPLVIRTTADGDVKVKVTDTSSTTLSGGTYLFSQTSSSLTETYTLDPQIARDEFTTDKIIIRESRLQSIPAGFSSFRITLPSGFTFSSFKTGNDPSVSNYVGVGLEPGLAWRDGSTGLGKYAGFDGSGNYSSGDYTIGFDVINGEIDESTVVVNLYNILASDKLKGSIYIQGLRVIADDNAPKGDIMATIKNRENDPVTEQKFVIGTRQEWDVILKTDGAIPELIAGRYNEENPLRARDEDHRAARVVFSENATNAWWSGKTAVFSLPEGVKWRMVDIYSVENLTDETKLTFLDTAHPSTVLKYGSTYQNDYAPTAGMPLGVYLNDGSKHGFVTIDGREMKWANMQIKTDKKAKIVFDSWISIAANYPDGNINLTVSGSAIPEQSTGGGVPSVTIAKSLQPVTVTAIATDVKIGLQWQRTGDIIITETKAGVLEKSKEVRVSITDDVSTDFMFSSDTIMQRTSGDLTIKDATTTGAGDMLGSGDTFLASGGGTLSFKINSASSTASTVTISNVSVKINRTVPESNIRPYSVVAWGGAIAPNYTYWNYNKTLRDKFDVPGVSAPYAKVVTSSSGNSDVLTAEVRVTIGDEFITVNGKTMQMDTSAYISPTSNSTMVPLRFVALAFGLTNEQIIWDPNNETITLLFTNRTVQFKIGSSTMLIDGVAVPMLSPDGLPVVAELNGDRSFVPFRAMGDATGVPVGWDAETGTAIYNPASGTDASDDAE